MMINKQDLFYDKSVFHKKRFALASPFCSRCGEQRREDGGIMAAYGLSCCSTVDLSRQWAEERDVKLAYFHFFLGEKEYLDDFYESIRPEELYQRMLAGEMTRTSQVNVEEYKALFRSVLSKGRDLLHITLSSGISGSINSARIAAEEMREEFPERKVYVLDSLNASSGYGLLVDRAADLRDAGMGIEELYEELQRLVARQQSWFFTSDLTFFIRGGRVSKAAGWIGSLLNICPLLRVAEDGSLKAVEKVRGKKRVMDRILQKMEELCKDGRDYSDKCFISHSDCREDAELLRVELRKRFLKLKTAEIFPIGSTIGCHTGPGTVALFFFGRE